MGTRECRVQVVFVGELAVDVDIDRGCPEERGQQRGRTVLGGEADPEIRQLREGDIPELVHDALVVIARLLQDDRDLLVLVDRPCLEPDRDHCGDHRADDEGGRGSPHRARGGDSSRVRRRRLHHLGCVGDSLRDKCGPRRVRKHLDEQVRAGGRRAEVRARQRSQDPVRGQRCGEADPGRRLHRLVGENGILGQPAHAQVPAPLLELLDGGPGDRATRRQPGALIDRGSVALRQSTHAVRAAERSEPSRDRRAVVAIPSALRVVRDRVIRERVLAQPRPPEILVERRLSLVSHLGLMNRLVVLVDQRLGRGASCRCLPDDGE